MDQRRSRWDTHEELVDYCRHSATTVGEMVLGVLGYRDPWRHRDERRHLHRPAARELLAGHRARPARPRPDLPAARVDGALRGDRGRPARPPSRRPTVRALVALEVALARGYLRRGEPLHRFVPRRVSPRPADVQRRRPRAVRRDRRARTTTRCRAAPRPGRLGRARIAAPPRGAHCGPRMTLEEAHRHCRDVARARGAQLLLRLHPAAARASAPDLRGLRVQPPRRRQRRRRDPADAALAAVAALRDQLDAAVGGDAAGRTTRCSWRWPTRSRRFAIPREHLDALHRRGRDGPRRSPATPTTPPCGSTATGWRARSAW